MDSQNGPEHGLLQDTNIQRIHGIAFVNPGSPEIAEHKVVPLIFQIESELLG